MASKRKPWPRRKSEPWLVDDHEYPFVPTTTCAPELLVRYPPAG